MSVEVLRADQRFRTRTEHLDSRHAFSYGHHYDPARTAHGLLLVCNDDVLRPGGGFPDHPHRDVELVTWVVSGSLAHRDTTGSDEVLTAGSVQRLSAGRGVVHSEMQDGTGDVRYVQSWVAPAALGTEPSYARADVALPPGELVALVGAGGALGMGQPDATLHAARLAPGDRVAVPAAAYVHVLVVTGSVRLDEERLDEGDSALLTAAGRRSLTGDGEVLVWEMRAGLSPAASPP